MSNEPWMTPSNGWLFSERRAYAAMSPRRRRLHRALHRTYYALPNWSAFRRLWGRYRRTWPTPSPSESGS